MLKRRLRIKRRHGFLFVESPASVFSGYHGDRFTDTGGIVRIDIREMLRMGLELDFNRQRERG